MRYQRRFQGPLRRWRMRMRLRTLIVFVVFVAVACGWFVRILREAEVQRETVFAISGWASYDPSWRDGPPLANSGPRAPKWLVDALGIDFFRTVVSVGLYDEASDAELMHVGKLRRLEELIAAGSSITDGGLVHLEGLSRLRSLDLEGASVSDAGMAHLAGLSNLRSLNLSDTEIGDAGLLRLAGLGRLEELHLRNTAVTDLGMAHLRRGEKIN